MCASWKNAFHFYKYSAWIQQWNEDIEMDGQYSQFLHCSK